VLSACDTALGGGYFAEVPAGDDIVGLTRAFLFAGSPSVVASLWAVNDRSTMRLMSGFYNRLLSTEGSRRDGGRGFSPGGEGLNASTTGPDADSTDKATALADAQRDLVARGGRYSHPYFWGAFVLVGQMK
jgi:CHAT domain-containing protein